MGFSPDDVEEDTWPDLQREERPVPLGTHSPERPALGPRQPPDHTARRDPPRPVGAAWPQANGPGWRNKPDPALCLSVLPSRQECKSARPGSLYVASTSPRRAWPHTPMGGPQARTLWGTSGGPTTPSRGFHL